jgi:hypothetical protein
MEWDNVFSGTNPVRKNIHLKARISLAKLFWNTNYKFLPKISLPKSNLPKPHLPNSLQAGALSLSVY